MRTRDISGKEIPYSDTENLPTVDLNVKTRLRYYQKILGDRNPGRTLDVGESNWIGRQMGAQENTASGQDFNWTFTAPKLQYDTIYCFEVIEHVMNPLFLLESLKNHLSVNGRIYLSTPVLGLITWYQYREHFAEYKLRNLHEMIHHAGMEIQSEDIFCPYPAYFALKGWRPALRVLFHRNVLFCLRVL
jgi:hypothetical protein